VWLGVVLTLGHRLNRSLLYSETVLPTTRILRPIVFPYFLKCPIAVRRLHALVLAVFINKDGFRTFCVMKNLITAVTFAVSVGGNAGIAILSRLWRSISRFINKSDLDTHGRRFVSVIELTPNHETGLAKAWHFVLVDAPKNEPFLKFVAKGFVKKEIDGVAPSIPENLDEKRLHMADYGTSGTDIVAITELTKPDGRPLAKDDAEFKPEWVIDG
tara:strand:+ start:10737 stop:11381 length:645 start_codon:yes stop_codon:yes gene_type:complete